MQGHFVSVFSPSDCYGEDADETPPFDFYYNGFIEFETVFSIDPDQDFSDANKKNEIRNRLEFSYGRDTHYLFSVTNLYLTPTFFNDDVGESYRYADEVRMERNGRISSEHFEADFRELYFNAGYDKIRFRLGNQIYGWGTADAFNPTSYFNPTDYREFIFKDDDENKSGVPSLSAMIFMDNYTLETVFMPVHVPMLLAPKGNFWYLHIEDDLYTVDFRKTYGMKVDVANMGYGARLSSSYRGADFSISAYHGPDREPVFVPESVVMTPNQKLSLQLAQQYYVVSMVGADFTTTIDDFVFQFELAYSPDKRNLVKQDFSSLQQISFPLKVETSHYLAYTIGFNYFIPLTKLIETHTGETVLTMEWYQGHYFNDDVYQPYLTDLISCKLEDTFYDGHIPISITTVFDTRSQATVFWPKIGYDFLNGWLVEVSYGAINGNTQDKGLTEPVFYYYKDNDIIQGNIRYEF